MTSKLLLIGLLIALAAGSGTPDEVGEVRAQKATVYTLQAGDVCPAPEVVEIRTADPMGDPAHHLQMRDIFILKAAGPNTSILLGPEVVLDFTDLPDALLPIRIGRCVTIQSVAWFGPARPQAEDVPPGAVVRAAADSIEGRPGRRDGIRRPLGTDAAEVTRDRPPEVMGERGPSLVPEARSSTAPGPLLRFGPHRPSGNKTFLAISCSVGESEPADHVRLAGFRIYGPRLGHQEGGDRGILIHKCVDVEIANMEIAGWGGEGVRVQDDINKYRSPEVLAEPWQLRRLPGVCHEPPYTGTDGRIGSPDQVRILDSYIHHNSQPRTTFDGHAGGYGVQVTYGAFAHIARNVFAFNRHAIEGAGTMGGYEAVANLVLRYGGVHYDGPVTVHTHQFDIHGTGDNGMGGFAGARTVYSWNAFQYRADNAISIRGSPRCGIEISHNVFPHPGLEDDRGDDAVKLHYRQDLEVIRLPDNQLNYDSFGRYAVCDFDADGIDDLFLPTGNSWWFSGMGEFPWRFLALRTERLERLRFGYFDADNRCDVVTESYGAWVMSSGGTGEWHRIGQAYAPLDEVQFGRFDPADRDHRAGATRRTTHAFWRSPTGQWKVTTLSGPEQGWRDVARSGLPMRDLRFGDFTGDGVTDVLAVQQGRWAISESAIGSWRRLNPDLGDEVRNLYFADVDNNNIDDILRLQYRILPSGQLQAREDYVWEISYDGTAPWQPLKTHSWVTTIPVGSRDRILPVFVGRFGIAPGAAVLVVDRGGIGRFYAPLESSRGAPVDWNSTFSY